VANIDPAAAKAEWHAYGVRCVYFTFSSFAGMTPAAYELKHPYSVYTADDMGGNYNAWAPTSYGYNGCTGEPPPVPSPVADNRKGALRFLADSVAYNREETDMTEETLSLQRQTLAWRVLNMKQSTGNVTAVRDALDKAGAPKP